MVSEGSPHLNPDAVFDYLLTPRALKAHFAAQKAPICFVGHTHIPESGPRAGKTPSLVRNRVSIVSSQALRRSSTSGAWVCLAEMTNGPPGRLMTP